MMIRESFGLRIASDPPARLWGGFGDLMIPADDIEGAPALYLGTDGLINAPDFQQLINGTADRLDFQLSGVSDATLPLVLEDAPSVKGAAVHLVRFEFDSDWHLIEVEYEAEFTADKLGVSSEDQGFGRRQRGITLSVGRGDTNRNRSPMAFFTDQDQRRRSVADDIFDHVSGINLGTSRRFGPR